MAVVDLNGSSSKDLPILGYAGFTWPNFIGTGIGKVLEANVKFETQLKPLHLCALQAASQHV